MTLAEAVKVTILNGNSRTKKLADNPVFYARSKHIDVRQHFVLQTIKENLIIGIEYAFTEHMGANMLTKDLPGVCHNILQMSSWYLAI